jgi:hypothetical protein
MAKFKSLLKTACRLNKLMKQVTSNYCLKKGLPQKQNRHNLKSDLSERTHHYSRN